MDENNRLKVLIVCSGNVPDNQKFDLKLHHAFVFEQVLELEKLGISFDFFYIKEKGIYGYCKSILQLRKKIKAKKFDIIHAHYGLCGLVATFQRKIPLIVTFHGCDINRNILNLLSSIVALFSRVNIFVSEDLQQKILIKTPNRNIVIPCGIDLKQFQPQDKLVARTKLNLNKSKKYALFASSIYVSVKNYGLAKKAIDLIPDVELLELARKTREEVSLLMNASDFFILTSLREGSPQTIKEAMACNCPIVSTDVGDVKLVIKNIEGCFLTTFEVSDVVEKIKMALNFVQTDIRTNGRKRILQLGLDGKSVAQKVFEVYNRVLKNTK